MARREVTNLSEALRPYLTLLQGFVSRAIPTDDFERAFNAQYLADDVPVSRTIFEVLDEFFADVDSYVSDPELRAQVYRAIGPEELRERAARLLTLGGYELPPAADAPR